MSTLIVSDLHLGSGKGSDVLRHPEPRAALLDAVRDIDRLVLLGDVLELRHGPPRNAMAAARPFFEDLGRVLAGREIVVSAGNHDHLLVESWLGERALAEPEPLGLEQRPLPAQASPLLAQIAEWASACACVRRLPGPVGASRCVRHPRALPGRPPDRAHDRAAERGRDEPPAGAPGLGLQPGRGLRGGGRPPVRLEERGGEGNPLGRRREQGRHRARMASARWW